jgi:hypothetical protein
VKFALTQALVTRYAKYSALSNLLEKWLKGKRDLIKAALQGGRACPDRGPYLLELVPAEERLDWNTEFSLWLEADGRSAEEIEKIFANIKAKPREKADRLEKKVNPNYRRPFPIRLPK